MNNHVDKGIETNKVALYINKLLKQKTWKAHYYFGKFGQKNRSSPQMDTSAIFL